MLRALISAAKAYLAVKAVEMAAAALTGRSKSGVPAPVKSRRMAKAARRPATRTKATA